MIDSYVQHRIYLQQFKLLVNRQGFEIVPVNMNYQSLIIVTTGVLEYGGKQFVFQTNSCGCGPQPTIRGAYLVGEIPWVESDLCAWFAASDTPKDRQLVGQKAIDVVYSVRLPVDEEEEKEIAAALRSHFGTNKEISFF